MGRVSDLDELSEKKKMRNGHLLRNNDTGCATYLLIANKYIKVTISGSPGLIFSPKLGVNIQIWRNFHRKKP